LRGRNDRLLAILWLALCLLLAAALAFLLPRSQLNSSVLALLPQQNLGAAPPALQQGFMQRLDRQMVWLVSPGEQDDPQVAAWWLAQLRALPDLKQVQGDLDGQQQQQWGRFAWQHRNGLMDEATRSRLQNGGGAQADWLLAQLFSAFSGVSSKELQGDPLMLVRGSQLALAQNAGRMTLHDGWLTVKDEQDQQWYFLHGELANNAFSMQQSHALVTRLSAGHGAVQRQRQSACSA